MYNKQDHVFQALCYIEMIFLVSVHEIFEWFLTAVGCCEVVLGCFCVLVLFIFMKRQHGVGEYVRITQC